LTWEPPVGIEPTTYSLRKRGTRFRQCSRMPVHAGQTNWRTCPNNTEQWCTEPETGPGARQQLDLEHRLPCDFFQCAPSCRWICWRTSRRSADHTMRSETLVDTPPVGRIFGDRCRFICPLISHSNILPGAHTAKQLDVLAVFDSTKARAYAQRPRPDPGRGFRCPVSNLMVHGPDIVRLRKSSTSRRVVADVRENATGSLRCPARFVTELCRECLLGKHAVVPVPRGHTAIVLR
jgi:hypothetical protein